MSQTMPEYIIPKAVNPGSSGTLCFTVTEEMVERFGELTGDRSLLHSKAEFARRSIYRKPVVHGMLTSGFVSLLGLFHVQGALCLPVATSASFTEPVFAGDELCLTGRVADIDRDTFTVRCAYTIEKAGSGQAAVKGEIRVRYTERGNSDKRNTASYKGPVCASLVSAKIELKELGLEDIKAGDVDGFVFNHSKTAADAFLDILASGLSKEPPVDSRTLMEGFSFEALLPLMLFSTSVGMCIPGKHATFIGFEAALDGAFTPGREYVLEGTVAHVSRSTRIIKKDIAVYPGGKRGATVLKGRVSILVNSPASMMPTVKELKETAVDLGLEGKVVLVTGASRGIGETTAKLFALHGAKVAINYLRGKADAERIAEEIKAEAGTAFPVKADVSDAEEVKRMFREIAAKYGAVDVLVNNAVRDFKAVPFPNLTWEEVQKDIDVVVKGAFNCCKEAVPGMIENGGGKIINISTIAAEDPPPGQAKYVMAKSALVGLTRSLSVEYAAGNIQVNMVVPNFVETDLTSHIQDAFKKKIAEATRMKRSASPVDVAHAVVFLASSYSAYMTGQKIMVTGGEAPFL